MSQTDMIFWIVFTVGVIFLFLAAFVEWREGRRENTDFAELIGYIEARINSCDSFGDRKYIKARSEVYSDILQEIDSIREKER